MKTHDFDRRMRVLAGQEVFAMSKESENRLRQALHSPQIRPAARRLSLRAVLVTALILALCGGIAVAAGAPAAIGATAEDPKSFGKSIIFVALGEGFGLYGLLISILCLMM